jgi:hypothetical protein
MARPRFLTQAEAKAVEALLDGLNDFHVDVNLTSRTKSPLTNADRRELDATVCGLTELLMRIRDRYCPHAQALQDPSD